MGYQAGIDGPMRAEPELNKVVEHCLINPLPPAMAYFMEGKPVQVASNSLKHVQKRWQESALEATAIVVIGVDVNPDDTHIWDFVKESRAAVGYVAPEPFVQKFLEWNKDNRPGKPHSVLSESFSDSINSTCDFLEEHCHAPD